MNQAVEVRTGSVRGAAFVVAVVSCVPYLALKVAWIAGSTLGIPADSVLLDDDHATSMRAVNALTVLMDSAVVGLALVLTRPWGRSVPAWLLLGPMWLACGLLGPILVGFPLQVIAGAVAPVDRPSSDDPAFLEPWVFSVVYTGFGVQALALGTLFVIYARHRWSALWRTRLDELGGLASSSALRGSAVAVAALALAPLTLRVSWALGSEVGLSEALVEQTSQDTLLANASFVPFTVAAVVGLALLAFRRDGSGVVLPLALAWAGSGAMAGWGVWLLCTSLGAGEVGTQPTPAMSLVYAAELGIGLLVISALGHLLAERSRVDQSRVQRAHA